MLFISLSNHLVGMIWILPLFSRPSEDEWSSCTGSFSFRIDLPWRFIYLFIFKYSQPSFWAVGERNLFISQQTLRNSKAARGSFKLSSKITNRRGHGRRCESELQSCPRQQRKAAYWTELGGISRLREDERDEVRHEDLKPTGTPEFSLPCLNTNEIKSDFTLFDCKRQKVHQFFACFWKGLLFLNTSGTEPGSYVRY